MNRELLTLINKKNDKYRDWKSTNNDVEYEVKKLTSKLLRELGRKILGQQNGNTISKHSQRKKRI